VSRVEWDGQYSEEQSYMGGRSRQNTGSSLAWWVLLLDLLPLSAAVALLGVLTWKLGWWVLIAYAGFIAISGAGAWVMARHYRRGKRQPTV